LNWIELKFKWSPDFSTVLTLVKTLPSSLRRLIRIARLLERRYQFFQVLRVIELIAYYSRYVELFERHRINLALTSNHSNPHGIAFAIAAQKAGVPTVLISHGMPVRPVARLG